MPRHPDMLAHLIRKKSGRIGHQQATSGLLFTSSSNSCSRRWLVIGCCFTSPNVYQKSLLIARIYNNPSSFLFFFTRCHVIVFYARAHLHNPGLFSLALHELKGFFIGYFEHSYHEGNRPWLNLRCTRSPQYRPCSPHGT